MSICGRCVHLCEMLKDGKKECDFESLEEIEFYEEMINDGTVRHYRCRNCEHANNEILDEVKVMLLHDIRSLTVSLGAKVGDIVVLCDNPEMDDIEVTFDKMLMLLCDDIERKVLHD